MVYLIYKIYDGTTDEPMYIGRTTQSIKKRVKAHLAERKFCESEICRIEVAEIKTYADMCLYESYYIDKYKPRRNRSGISKDRLTIELPELDFVEVEYEKRKIYLPLFI